MTRGIASVDGTTSTCYSASIGDGVSWAESWWEPILRLFVYISTVKHLASCSYLFSNFDGNVSSSMYVFWAEDKSDYFTTSDWKYLGSHDILIRRRVYRLPLHMRILFISTSNWQLYVFSALPCTTNSASTRLTAVSLPDNISTQKNMSDRYRAISWPPRLVGELLYLRFLFEV